MGDEVELKYEIEDADAVIAWLDENLPMAPGYGWRTVYMTDTYFDTADQALAKAGYGARLRRLRSRWTVGVKSDLAVEGAEVRRTDVEADATADLDAGAWPASEARDLVRRLCRAEPLVERFRLQQRRRRRDFGGLELSVDEVAVRHGRRLVGKLTELEVEYKSGRRSELARVGRMVGRSGLARAEPRSKMALAATMVEGAAPIYPGDPLAEAGRKVLGRLLERFVEREGAMRQGDALALKQMRVASRRMRATWRAFDGAYGAGDVRRYVSELRSIADRLGAVRDLDVLLENLPADEGLDALRGGWAEKRDALWNELLDELDTRDYARFLADYRQFVDTPGAASTRAGRTTRVADGAASRIWAAYERMRAAAPVAGRRAAPDDLHALRIAARQFRYTLEAYRELLAPDPTARLMERLVRLQDLVGALNDADVASHEVAAWMEQQAEPPPAVVAYRAGLESEVGRLVGQVAPAARGVLGITFRRLLGRAVSAV